MHETDQTFVPLSESTGTTIDAGTIVVTGTPAGVGYSQHPPRILTDGDIVTVSLEGVGNLTNTIRNV